MKTQADNGLLQAQKRASDRAKQRIRNRQVEMIGDRKKKAAEQKNVGGNDKK